ncbi:Major facilitator superfamily domain-containing protein [Madurella fahalii]|uniref:Major facilitator superfamily domain-containing protein n=1 Tax=Madurella fahalii TaxID=1157608 RepID=A0ABQ0G3G6_9PEZI
MRKGIPIPPEPEQHDRAKKAAASVTITPSSASLDESDTASGSGSDAGSTRTTAGSAADRLLGNTGPASIFEIASSVSDVDERFPEGGIRAWFIVLGCWLGLFASLGLMNILAAFPPYISTNHPLQPSTGAVGGIIGGYTFLNLSLGIYVGPLFDKYGPRWLILAGTVCLVASLLLVNISTSYWSLLLALGILSSLGSSLLFTPSIAAIGHFFHDRRGLATGVATTAGPASAIVFPYLLRTLFVSIGFAWAVRALALACLAPAAIANFLIRSRRLPPLPPSTAKNSPPHAINNNDDNNNNNTKPPAAAATARPDPRIFRARGYTRTVIAIFLSQFASFLSLAYFSAYMLGKGFANAFAFDVVAALNASSAVGRVAGGWAADKAGAFNASVVVSAVAALACFAVWLPAGGTGPGIVVFAVLLGLASGAASCLVPVAVGRLCKTREYGRYYATCYSVVSLAVLVAVPLAGAVVGAAGGDYWGLVVMTGLLYVAAAVAFALAKVEVVGKRMWVTF